MRIDVGDRIVLLGASPPRHAGTVLEIRDRRGVVSYHVAFEDDDTLGLVFAGADTIVEHRAKVRRAKNHGARRAASRTLVPGRA